MKSKCHDCKTSRKKSRSLGTRQYKETAYLLKQEPLLIIYVDACDVSANDGKLLTFVNIGARQRRLCHNVLHIVCRGLQSMVIFYPNFTKSQIILVIILSLLSHTKSHKKVPIYLRYFFI